MLPDPETFTLCEVVAGACLAVRRTTWEALEGMDESFFLYAEDTDFCKRAKDAGWLIGYAPEVHVPHAWGASRATAPAQSTAWHARSLAAYFHKHYPKRPLANRCLALLLHAHAGWRRLRS